ncbi:hypothetical protein D3C73_1044840 [compost metagenome]
MTTDADVAALQVVQPSQQRDQRRFARAIGSQQRGESSRRQVEAHLVQRLSRTVGKAQFTDLKGVHGVTTTPHG